MKHDFNKLGLCLAFTLPKMTINDGKQFPKFFFGSSGVIISFISRSRCFRVKKMLMEMNQLIESDYS